MKYYYSNCCNSIVTDPDEIGVCSKCKEPCDVYSDGDGEDQTDEPGPDYDNHAQDYSDDQLYADQPTPYDP